MAEHNVCRSFVCGARRRALVGTLYAAGSDIRLCALAGYGKTAFTHVLRAQGVTAAVHEQRGLRACGSIKRSVVVSAAELAFDEEELALLFAPLNLAARTLARVAEATHGWPAGALYLRRLAYMGVLDRALRDYGDSAFDDLAEYVEENVYAPASRAQRLALVTYETPPLLRAAIRSRHGEEIDDLFLRLARGAQRRSRALHAARWYLAARRTSEANDIIRRLPLETLRLHARSETDQTLRRHLASRLRHVQARLRIRLFDGAVTLDGSEISLVQRETAVLFALAASAERSVEAKRLARDIWPELDAQHAHASLKVTASRLRARLGEGDFIGSARGRYHVGEQVHVDLADVLPAIDAFDQDGDVRHVEAFAPLIGASRPPRLRDAEWFAPIEAHLVRIVHRIGDALAGDAITRGDAAAVLRIGRALLQADPCDEAGCALMVRGHLLEGRADAARREYDRFAQSLRSELGCAPSMTFEALRGAECA